MSNERRRELARAYKQKPVRAGAYAVACSATGQVWVSASPNLDAQQNSLFFQLRAASFPNRALQSAWNTHGEANFTYEELAELSAHVRSAYALKADLQALEQEWRDKLGAKAVTG